MRNFYVELENCFVDFLNFEEWSRKGVCECVCLGVWVCGSVGVWECMSYGVVEY